MAGFARCPSQSTRTNPRRVTSRPKRASMRSCFGDGSSPKGWVNGAPSHFAEAAMTQTSRQCGSTWMAAHIDPMGGNYPLKLAHFVGEVPAAILGAASRMRWGHDPRRQAAKRAAGGTLSSTWPPSRYLRPLFISERLRLSPVKLPTVHRPAPTEAHIEAPLGEKPE